MANPTVATTATNALSFMNNLQAQQNQAFAGNQAALGALSSAWAPVMQTGTVPYGYSKGLDSLLQSNIINTGAAATANAQNASALQQRQLSGGAPGAAPTGAQAQIAADIAAKGQQATAGGLQQEKIAGYQQGLQNLEGATNAELGIAGGENETGLASGATSAGNLALNAGQAQWQENQTTSPLNLTKDILGDVGAAAGDVTGVGNVASMFGGSGGSSSSTAPTNMSFFSGGTGT